MIILIGCGAPRCSRKNKFAHAQLDHIHVHIMTIIKCLEHIHIHLFVHLEEQKGQSGEGSLNYVLWRDRGFRANIKQ